MYWMSLFSSKYSGVIAHFNQYHVKIGDFSKETSKIIRTTSEMREHADYEDFFCSVPTGRRRTSEEEIFHQYILEYLRLKGVL